MSRVREWMVAAVRFVLRLLISAFVDVDRLQFEVNAWTGTICVHEVHFLHQALQRLGVPLSLHDCT